MLKLLAFLALALSAYAQQTIFNVPSADVAVRGDWFYQHQTVARAWGGQKHWVQTNSFGYGVGHNIELDASWYNVEPGAVGQSSPSVGLKYSLPLRKTDKLLPMRLVVGDMIEFRDRSANNLPDSPHEGNWLYAMLSADVPKTRTRITGGFTDGTSVLFGIRKFGALAGVEQPITDKWMFQADWFQGKHDLVYAIPGVVYKFSERWMLSLGYQIPNRDGSGFQGIVVELTRF